MDIKSLVDTFFETDNLKELLEQAGRMLDCPLLVVDDAFRIAASYWPNSFQDEVFFGALRRGEITYEAILAISQSEQIAQGQRVESFRIHLPGARALYEGTTIGNRKICRLHTKTDRLVIHITAARDTVLLDPVEVY